MPGLFNREEFFYSFKDNLAAWYLGRERELCIFVVESELLHGDLCGIE